MARGLIVDDQITTNTKTAMSSPYAPVPATPSKSSSQWYFTKRELLSSPSIQAGLSPKEEKANRVKGCQLIAKVGHSLRLHHTTLATAAMFFHRFYMRFPMQKFHHYVYIPEGYAGNV
jgi:hypothetical protein